MVAANEYRVIVAPQAFAQIDRIIDWVAARSPSAAVKLIDRLWNSVNALGRFPTRYRIVRDHRAGPMGVRRMPVPPHLIYYRVDPGRKVVRVVAVLDGRRPQPRRFD